MASVIFAFGTLAGGFLSWTIQWRAQSQKLFSPFAFLKGFFDFRELRSSLRDKRIQRIFSMIAPAVLTVGVLQVNIFVNTGLAADLGEGSVTWLNYAYRLLHFPMGVFGVSLFMAALPKLSELSTDRIAFGKTLQEATGLSLYVSIGAAAGLYVFAEPILALLFEHGRFTRLDVSQTAVALQAYSLGLLAFNMNKIFNSAFFALESMWTPALLSFLSIVANYFFSSYLSRHFGHSGIALSVSLTSLLTTLVLILFLKKKDVSVSFLWIFRVLIGSLVCTAPMFFLYYMGVGTIIWDLKAESFALGLLALLAAMALSGAVFLFLSVLFLREGREFYSRFIQPRLNRAMK